MRCPFCDNGKTRVTDKRSSGRGQATRRRRECLRCGKRFTTYERVEGIVLSVIKSNGRKEPYDRKKLEAGLKKACEKLPIAKEKIEKAIDRIESKLRKHGEIKSRKIGEFALRELKKLDKVAYMRFVSVYKSFEDVDSFKKEANMLKVRKKKK